MQVHQLTGAALVERPIPTLTVLVKRGVLKPLWARSPAKPQRPI